MFESWYDYMQPKWGKILKSFYMDTDSFINYIKADDIYEDIAKDVNAKFDTSNYELYWPLKTEK